MKRHFMAVPALFRLPVVAATALFAALILPPGSADAANAHVRWWPTSGAVNGYRVYVRNSGAAYGTPVWSGNPAPAADGTITASVTYTTAPSGVNYFAVAAIADAAGAESGLSQELFIGSPNPCVNDRCFTKTSCDFSVRPDGSSCSDDTFCNGDELCRAGACSAGVRSCADAIACTVDACDEASNKCTHAGPPGCCLACDAGDPCLADACSAGDCSAPEGAEVDVKRVKMTKGSSGIKLAAKAAFLLDGTTNPAVTGVEFAFLAADGTELFRSVVPAESFREGASPGRYRFAGARAELGPEENGVFRIDFRVKKDRWLLTLKAETTTLEDAFAEPTLSVMLRLGGSACVRHRYMACKQTASKSVCR